MPAIVLNEQDRNTVNAFLESLRVRRVGRPQASAELIVDSSPDVLIIRPLVTSQMIPKRGRHADGTPRPGGLVVGVWKLQESPPKSNNWSLVPVTYPSGVQRKLTLRNVDNDKLEYDFYDLSRDAFGRWVISCCT